MPNEFLCDVHISFKVVRHLNQLGHNSIHVNDILDKWYTKDWHICEYADVNDFVVITKDADFRDTHFIKNTPKKLIKINLGNIHNKSLLEIISQIYS